MSIPYQQHQQPPFPQAQGGQLGTYTSPIAVRQATFKDALASEWTKIRSVRSTVWTLGVLLVVLLGVGLLFAFLVGSGDQMGTGVPALAYGAFGVIVGSLCVITLGVLTISSEYGTGMIRPTLTACPSRGRILAAKSVVFFLLSFAIVTIGATVVAVIHNAKLTYGPPPTGEEWLLATVGIGLYVAMLGLLSLAVGALIRHSAGAIAIMIGVVLLPLVFAMFMYAEPLTGVRNFLMNYSIPSQMIAMYGTSPGSAGPSGWDSLWIITGITAAALGGAYFALKSRDA
ncbi:ABC transporter permease subunit [Streptomyces sp. NPDC006632]|uniref:ABC transporter permease subunit n=1 Tax=unclassified Streptomyces TaxID=2593676 RepID=UPI002E224631